MPLRSYKKKKTNSVNNSHVTNLCFDHLSFGTAGRRDNKQKKAERGKRKREAIKGTAPGVWAPG